MPRVWREAAADKHELNPTAERYLLDSTDDLAVPHAGAGGDGGVVTADSADDSIGAPAQDFRFGGCARAAQSARPEGPEHRRRGDLLGDCWSSACRDGVRPDWHCGSVIARGTGCAYSRRSPAG